MQSKIIQRGRKGKGLLGLAAGVIGTGMLLSQAQAAASLDPYYQAGPIHLDFFFGFEGMNGDLTSSIGGEINHANGENEATFFPISELEWPMDITLARFDGSLELNPLWRINATMKTALGDPEENMIDRDWFSAGGPADIYSESSISSSDAFILAIDLEWTYFQQGPWSLSAGVGYLQQEFEYEGDLIIQYSPTGISGYNYIGNGSTAVTYDNTFSMFYFLLGANMQLTPQFELAGKFSVAPFASSEDELHHLYSGKVSTGDMEGMATMLEMSGKFLITPWWFVKGGVQLAYISVDGDQYQVLAGEPLGQIDQEVESNQASAYISMGYSF
ncbi:MAG: omptin family outer membrane protease [Candidatus Electrothrix scaldis]|nr:MAG: omptin family outer membrane protease [Candidatus Electrothrix sp. GW3-3]